MGGWVRAGEREKVRKRESKSKSKRERMGVESREERACMRVVQREHVCLCVDEVCLWEQNMGEYAATNETSSHPAQYMCAYVSLSDKL